MDTRSVTKESGGALRTGTLGSLRHRLGQGELGPLPIVIGMAVIWIYFQLQDPNFLTPRNLSFLLLQMTITSTVATGIVLVLLLGEIDLSAGSVTGLSAAILGVLLVQQHQPLWLAVLIMLVVAALIGAAQGSIAAYVGVPAFVVTLAGMLGWLGMQLWVLGPNGSINVSDPSLTLMFTTYVPPILGWAGGITLVAAYAGVRLYANRQRRSLHLSTTPWTKLLVRPSLVAVLILVPVGVLNQWRGVPLAVLIMLLMVAAIDLLLTRTSFGQHIFAVGGNPEAARRAGINVAAVRVTIFAMCALMAGVAGLMSVSRSFAASTQTGGGTLLLEAIAAAVIGGTSLFGGRGSVWSAPLGALVMASLANGLDLTGESADIKYIVEMIVLLVAVTVDALARRGRATAGR